MNNNMHKLLLIYNPKAGKGSFCSKLPSVIDLYTSNGYMVSVYPTQEKMDGANLLSRLNESYDLIVCCGGDGTLNEIITGIMRNKISTPIGYIPCGSTNDFANSLGLPRQIHKAAERSISNNLFRSDIGSFEDKYFVYVAAFGLFSDVSYTTNQDMKNILGHSAYIIEGAKSLINVPQYHIKVEGDIELEDDYILGMITNSQSVGGFKRLFGNEVALDDGYYELTLAKTPKNPIEFQEMVSCFLNGHLNMASNVTTAKISSVTIKCSQPISWSLDGEFGGEFCNVDIFNNKQAVTIKI